MKIKLALLGLLIASPVFAGELAVQGGWSHTSNSNYGDSGQIVVRAENSIYKDLSLGLEGAYHGKQEHSPYGSLSGESVLGELIYYVPVNWKLKPYILGGLGWSWWSWDSSQDMKDKGIEISVGDSFAKKVGIGVDYELRDGWSINLEWDYFQSQIPKYSHYSDGTFANVVTDESTLGQEEFNLMLGVKKRF